MEERTKRKLSAILSADVKGYSRLMGQDELATVQTLEAHRKMISEIVRNYNGRVVDSHGDNILADFSIAQQLIEANSDFSLSSWKLAYMYKNYEDTERLLNALRKAGLK